MIVVNWDENVPTKVLRDSSWEIPTRFIADATRCGVRKVRMANNQEPTRYNVKIRMNMSQKNSFIRWFKNNLDSGTLAFWFKDISKETDKILAYRFVEGTSVSFSNPSGKIVDVTMTWETVDGVVNE